MEPDLDDGRVLHDRVTRGELLSEAELRQLEAWYAGQDAIEAALLGSKTESAFNLAPLESQISDTLEKIADLTHRIQQVSAENDRLRRENNALKSELVSTSA